MKYSDEDIKRLAQFFIAGYDLAIKIVEKAKELNEEAEEILIKRAVIAKALEKAGYDCEPTEENLKDCFMDYVLSGAWSNLDIEEAQELTLYEMCHALIKLK